MDIRQYGSGNAGTTNALRTLGKKAGAMYSDRGHVKMRARHSGGGRRFSKISTGIYCPCLECIRQQAVSLDIISPSI